MIDENLTIRGSTATDAAASVFVVPGGVDSVFWMSPLASVAGGLLVGGSMDSFLGGGYADGSVLCAILPYPRWLNAIKVRSCMRCSIAFTALSEGSKISCRSCGSIVCSNCLGER